MQQNEEQQQVEVQKSEFEEKLLIAIGKYDWEQVQRLLNAELLKPTFSLNLNLTVVRHFIDPILTAAVTTLSRAKKEAQDDDDTECALMKDIILKLISRAHVNPNEMSSCPGDKPLYLKLIEDNEFDLAYKILEKANVPVNLETKTVKTKPRREIHSREVIEEGKEITMNPIEELRDLANLNTPGIQPMIYTLLFLADPTPEQYKEYAKTFPEQVKAVQQIKQKIIIILDNFSANKNSNLVFQKAPFSVRINFCLNLLNDIPLSEKVKAQLCLRLSTAHQKKSYAAALKTIPELVVREVIWNMGIQSSSAITEAHQASFKKMITDIIEEKIQKLDSEHLGRLRGPFLIFAKNNLLAYVKQGALSKHGAMDAINKSYYQATFPSFMDKIHALLGDYVTTNIRGITEENKGYHQQRLYNAIYHKFVKEDGKHRADFIEVLRQSFADPRKHQITSETLMSWFVNAVAPLRENQPLIKH